MERFRKYFGRELSLDNINDEGLLDSCGVTCTYLPDPVEDFDEFEFRTGFGGQDNIVITVTVEMGKIKRLMFSAADEKNPDIVRSLTEDQLQELLSGKGKQLVQFFEHIVKKYI